VFHDVTSIRKVLWVLASVVFTVNILLYEIYVCIPHYAPREGRSPDEEKSGYECRLARLYIARCEGYSRYWTEKNVEWKEEIAASKVNQKVGLARKEMMGWDTIRSPLSCTGATRCPREQHVHKVKQLSGSCGSKYHQR
jgi:hypothetical protein